MCGEWWDSLMTAHSDWPAGGAAEGRAREAQEGSRRWDMGPAHLASTVTASAPTSGRARGEGHMAAHWRGEGKAVPLGELVVEEQRARAPR